mgnify:CR=1 FL=1
MYFCNGQSKKAIIKSLATYYFSIIMTIKTTSFLTMFSFAMRRFNICTVITFLLMFTMALLHPPSAAGQGSATDSEKRMIEEASDLFVYLSVYYKNGHARTEYLKNLFEDDERYRFQESDSVGVIVIEDRRFPEMFGYHMTLRLSEKMYQLALSPESTHLFEFWEYAITWRMARSGMLSRKETETETDVEQNMQYESKKDEEIVEISYIPAKEDTSWTGRIGFQSIRKGRGVIKAQFTAAPASAPAKTESEN